MFSDFFIINRIRKVCEIVTAVWFGYSRFGGYEYGWLVYIQCKHQCMWQCKAMEMRLEFDSCPSRSAIEAAVDHLQHCDLSMWKPMVDSEGNFGGSRQIGVGERCDSVWTLFVFGHLFPGSLKGGHFFVPWWETLLVLTSDIQRLRSQQGGLQALHPPKRESQVNSVNSIPFSGLPNSARKLRRWLPSTPASKPVDRALANSETVRISEAEAGWIY